VGDVNSLKADNNSLEWHKQYYWDVKLEPPGWVDVRTGLPVYHAGAFASTTLYWSALDQAWYHAETGKKLTGSTTYSHTLANGIRIFDVPCKACDKTFGKHYGDQGMNHEGKRLFWTCTPSFGPVVNQNRFDPQFVPAKAAMAMAGSSQADLLVDPSFDWGSL